MTNSDGRTDRALSQEATAAIGFGATVAMVAIAGFLLMGAGSNMAGGGAVLTVTAEDVDPRNDVCCQRVRITHESGDSVPLESLVLVVTFSDHDKRARLHDIPTAVLDQGDYRGHHVFMLGDEGIGGEADADDGSGDGSFNAGDTIEFRVAHRRVDLTAGETVTVRLVDSESDRQLAQVNATVR